MTAHQGAALADLSAVDRADVYKTGRLAGILERNFNDITFSYTTDYLDAGGPPVPSTLPWSRTPVRASGGSVPPFFAGLLPEGVRLTEPAPALLGSEIADADLTEVFVRATSADPDELERVALPGVQAKVSAAMISTPVNTAAGPVTSS